MKADNSMTTAKFDSNNMVNENHVNSHQSSRHTVDKSLAGIQESRRESEVTQWENAANN